MPYRCSVYMWKLHISSVLNHFCSIGPLTTKSGETFVQFTAKPACFLVCMWMFIGIIQLLFSLMLVLTLSYHSLLQAYDTISLVRPLSCLLL
eukprot:c20397_g1_i1 orf=43-318(-)